MSNEPGIMNWAGLALIKENQQMVMAPLVPTNWPAMLLYDKCPMWMERRGVHTSEDLTGALPACSGQLSAGLRHPCPGRWPVSPSCHILPEPPGASHLRACGGSKQSTYLCWGTWSFHSGSQRYIRAKGKAGGRPGLLTPATHPQT
ncbi:unnamed protein product [Nyctereutes procyonoides]|uniref:(raccoon dog) hypothetical protein n=1 Tax=Nyctereutes procyonoides TaxID=34880 RepID=A0A811YM64_NYCPR|nr:unnamed protein product [Nyctereutes procyonoides]